MLKFLNVTIKPEDCPLLSFVVMLCCIIKLHWTKGRVCLLKLKTLFHSFSQTR